jgi:hypothetical protein
MNTRLDHLVVAADTLEQGVAWCEAAFGLAPGPGGRHPLFGTHNRLLKIATPVFEDAYLEIIAVDPQAPSPARPRWFGLDDAALQARLQHAPRLIHLVARSPRLDDTLAAWRALGLDAGQAVAAERASPQGLYRWRIAGRTDGRLLCGGALPTLIEWQGMHPSAHLPASGVALQALNLGGLPDAAAAALGLHGVRCQPQGVALSAAFDTPRGRVTLSSED